MTQGYVILGTIDAAERFGNVKFNALFRKEVLDKENIAWYVDYWTEDAERYNVRYFSKSPLIHWTNENKAQRDPKDPDSRWGSDEVVEWFSGDRAALLPKGTYAHTLTFEASRNQNALKQFFSAPAEERIHRVRLEAGRITVNGLPDERAWDRYVEHGIRGALSDFSIKRLVSLTIEQV